MATAIREEPQVNLQPAADRALTELAWREIDKASFAVVSYVTPSGEPRSSGVVYATAGRRLYLTVAPDSWKARHIALDAHVSVTVPVRRGGLLSVLFPIPPATITFSAAASVRPPGAFDLNAISARLARLIPSETAQRSALIELTPSGQFLTYGIGVPLMQMRDTAQARGRAPVSS